MIFGVPDCLLDEVNKLIFNTMQMLGARLSAGLHAPSPFSFSLPIGCHLLPYLLPRSFALIQSTNLGDDFLDDLTPACMRRVHRTAPVTNATAQIHKGVFGAEDEPGGGSIFDL
jgi:hypothetical protein